jgi:hypothetical protein
MVKKGGAPVQHSGHRSVFLYEECRKKSGSPAAGGMWMRMNQNSRPQNWQA